MRLSEYIKRLQELVMEHGDLDVVIPKYNAGVPGKGLVNVEAPGEPKLEELYTSNGESKKMMLLPGRVIRDEQRANYPHVGRALRIV